MFSIGRRAPVVLAGIALGVSLTAGVSPMRAGAIVTTQLVVTTSADPTSNTACPATTGNPCSLRQAVNTANGGGSYAITFAIPGPFHLATTGLVVDGGETLSIQGLSDGSTVITTDRADRVIVVDLGSTLTLTDVTVTNGYAQCCLNPNNSFDGFGGALGINSGSTVDLIRTAITNNEAANGGGGVDVNSGSTLLALDSTFSGNKADGSIFGQGGAIDVNTTSTATVIDSTLANNSGGGAGGGGISILSGNTATLVNDTVSGNSVSGGAATGGGVLAQASASTSITNTIVSGNGTNNCSGTVTDGGHNLEQGTTCGFTASAVNADPQLAGLASNGGLGQTMALDPGSPAIDAGNDTVCAAATNATTPGAGAIDERGAIRPQGAHCDIGAFEVIATSTSLSAPSAATHGTSVTLTATVTASQDIPGTPRGTVSFFDGPTLLGTAVLSASSVATLQTSGLGLGVRSLTASFSATPLFLASASAPVAVTVSPPVPEAGSAGTVPTATAGILLLGGALLLLPAGGWRRGRRRRPAP